jgi:ribosomal protein L22
MKYLSNRDSNAEWEYGVKDVNMFVKNIVAKNGLKEPG